MAESDWDRDAFEPVISVTAAVGSSRWDGEDEEEEIKDSWEEFAEEEKDDKENESKDESKVQTGKVKKKKTLKDIVTEKEEKKRQDLEKRKQLEEPASDLTPEEAIEEKLRQQRLQEEAELELVKETFGTENDVKYGLESMNPTSKEDFDLFRKALVETISSHERSPCYVAFLDDFFRELCVNLEAEDLKKLGNTLHVLANEKVKAAKASSKGKKKKSKASLYVGKPGDYDYAGEYEGNEFDDFM